MGETYDRDKETITTLVQGYLTENDSDYPIGNRSDLEDGSLSADSNWYDEYKGSMYYFLDVSDKIVEYLIDDIDENEISENFRPTNPDELKADIRVILTRLNPLLQDVLEHIHNSHQWNNRHSTNALDESYETATRGAIVAEDEIINLILSGTTDKFDI